VGRVILGTPGNETLQGGEEADTLRGGGGLDLLQGGGGDDVLFDPDGGDTLAGGAGDDAIIGNGRGGTADGGDGNDRLTGLASGLALGGAGNDTIDAAANSTITGGAGQDSIILPSTVYAADLPITVTDFAAGAAGDRLSFVSLLGGPGITGYDGTNPFGAAGYLRLRQDGADAVVELDSDGGANGFIPLLRLSGVTATTLTTANLGFDPAGANEPGLLLTGDDGRDDHLTGRAGQDTITGGGGDDDLSGEGGADVLEGGAGRDHLFGGLGHDTLRGGEGGDWLYGDAGNNRLEGGEGDDYLWSDGGADTLIGGAGNDTTTGGFVIDGGAGDDSIGAPAVALIDGGAGDDTITAFAGSRISGGEGRDVIGPRWSDFPTEEPIIVTDFAPDSALGDRLNFARLLGESGAGYDGGNPFATGHLRLWQNGADAQIDFDRDGGGDGFAPLLRLSGVDALALTPGRLGFDPGEPVPGIALSRDGVAGMEPAARYGGPVAWLQWQFLGRAAGEVALGTTANDFMNLLGGDDAANGGAGDDVLDGGTGSNFLGGGEGRDVFFLDGRGGTATWSTITDWQVGEELSIWGWRPGVSRAGWVASDGAEGFRGATLHADLDADGVLDTSITWAGPTRAQLPEAAVFDGLLWFR
jgi:Ca2+-binding RTX toxin-like protein